MNTNGGEKKISDPCLGLVRELLPKIYLESPGSITSASTAPDAAPEKIVPNRSLKRPPVLQFGAGSDQELREPFGGGD